jgi:hypothetical protein
MSRICWWLVELLSRMLEPDEASVVRGDFAESGESGGRALRGLLGLVIRRQAALWKDWRPWISPIALAAPVLVTRGGRYSIWISVQLETLWTYGVRYESGLTLTDDIVTMVCGSLLLISWAWSGGFVLGSLSRRTAWIHPAVLLPVLWFSSAILLVLFFLPLHKALLRLLPQVALILIPFLSGVHSGVRRRGLEIGRASLFAVAIAIFTIILQVEDERGRLAFAAWSSGGALDGRLAWTPRLLPFAAIAWQFVLMVASTANWRREENRI